VLIEKWNEVVITLDNNFITVKFNSKIVFDKFQDADLLAAMGFLGVGANFKPVKFAGIKLSRIAPPLMAKTAPAKAKGFGSVTAGSMAGPAAEAPEDMDGDAESEELGPEEEDLEEEGMTDKKEEIIDTQCLENNNVPTRKTWCEIEQGYQGSNSAKCVKNFCNMCCTLLSKDLGKCVAHCEENTKPSDMEPVIAEKCHSQESGENFKIKLETCISCCADNTTKYITPQSSQACLTKC